MAYPPGRWPVFAAGVRAGPREEERKTPNDMSPFNSLRSKRPAAFAGTRGALALARCERGAAVVEFAVLVPVLLLIVFGIGDFGLATNTYNNETQLANEGARWAVVDANPGSGSLQDYIRSQGDTSQIRTGATVCIAFPSNPDTGTSEQIGDPVQVTVSVDHEWLAFLKNVLLLPSPSTTITGSATMRLEQTPTAYGSGCSTAP
jgi:Flp pilus assembly protein TadG